MVFITLIYALLVTRLMRVPRWSLTRDNLFSIRQSISGKTVVTNQGGRS